MGFCKNIKYDRFPKQSDDVGKEVLVCFHHDTSHTMKGTLVRDDMEDPYRTIIQLENGQFVLGTECAYTFQIPAGKAVQVDKL